MRSIPQAASVAVLSLSIACSGTDPEGNPCAPAALTGHLGCEFLPTVTANAVDGDFAFGVGLVNPGPGAADVRIEGGGLGAALELTVDPATSQSRTLPWVGALKACSVQGSSCTAAEGTSVLAAGGAYRVTSTRPIAVTQFSPIVGFLTEGAGSADATALPPAHAIGTSYVVAAWGVSSIAGASFPGFLAVTAAEDGTTVTVTTTVSVAAGDVPEFAGGVPTAVTLDRGDVLQLLAQGGDLTGSTVTSTKPIQVIGGHFCALVPDGVAYCDHLEEAMPPVAALGTTYVLVPPRVATLPQGKKRIVRIVGTVNGTSLAYSAVLPGAPGTLSAGQYADLESDQPFRLVATRPVLVAEYMEGFSAGGDEGDPSLAIALPVDRWQRDYSVFLPGFESGYADVVAPTGATVRLNGALTLAFTPIPGSGYGLATVGFGGAYHAFTGDQPFGLSVYGTQGEASYWYVPGIGP